MTINQKYLSIKYHKIHIIIISHLQKKIHEQLKITILKSLVI